MKKIERLREEINHREKEREREKEKKVKKRLKEIEQLRAEKEANECNH